jgi:hypothetical protein
MTRRWFFIPVFIGVLLLVLSFAISARAQEPTPVNDENCTTCHQNQYLVNDTGHWFCLCDAPMHCVYCHGGRTDTSDKKQAHEGLVRYPTSNESTRCLSCHDEDYQSRVEKLSKFIGIHTTPIPVVNVALNKPAIVSVEQSPVKSLLRFRQLDSWQLVGLGFLGVAMIAVGFFGYRCYKADCLSKNKR